MHAVSHAHILGIALMLAFILGKFASKVKIPAVTAYIFVGIILGPTLFNVLTHEVSEGFDIIKEVAFGLILFNIGGEFHRELFNKMVWKHIKFVLLFGFFIFITVGTICFIFSLFTDFSLMHKLAFSSFLGLIAAAAAPPTTLLVIKEYNTDGPLTHLITIFLAIGTIIAIISTHLFTIIFETAGIWEKSSEIPIWLNLIKIVWSIAGSFIVGIILGFILSYWVQKERSRGEIMMAVICFILLAKTLSFYLGLEPLLVSLFLGFSLVNTSPTGEHIHIIIKEIGLSIYAIFFILAGAHIDLAQQIQTVGILSLGYIFARCVGLITSSFLAAKICREPKIVGNFMGLGLLSHAGAALAIVLNINSYNNPSAKSITEVVMISIIFFEIVGPLTLKYILSAAGEMKNTICIDNTISKASLSLTNLYNNFFDNIGFNQDIELNKLHNINYITDRKVIAIKENATFRQLRKYMDEHRSPIYPVVDVQNKYLGVISLRLIDSVQSHSSIGHNFYLANKFIGHKSYLSENASYEEAMELFNKTGALALPVVTKKTKHLIGILHYQDIFLAK